MATLPKRIVIFTDIEYKTIKNAVDWIADCYEKIEPKTYYVGEIDRCIGIINDILRKVEEE